MLEFLQWIIVIVKIVPWVVMGASVVAAVTPTPKDDMWIAKYYKVLDLFAINIGKAKDK
tara:strand:+ start:1360 stop:1536 length:177 start_codon:yes stop_codon:yes gene_type:complete